MLSTALIVKNEEAVLEKCLESVKDSDEIIIVDTGSTDKTVEIAKKYGKVFHFKWVDNFAKARNEALKHCTGDWVLSIDADEHLEPDGIKKIKQLIQNTDKRVFSLKLTSGNNSHHLARLFKREGAEWKGEGHEHINFTEANQVDIQITYGYSPAHNQDPDRMLRIMEKAYKESPYGRNAYYLAREYYYRKNYPLAIWYFNDCTERSNFFEEKTDAMLFIARCYWFLQKGDKARTICFEAIKRNPMLKEALLFMAEMHYEPYKSKWIKLAGVADNSDALFIRNSPLATIPKIIHQIWIGEKPAPMEWINTWKEKNPDFEHILWDEEKIAELGLENQKVYNNYYDKKIYNGASNIARAEILKQHGGIYIDADSECVEPLKDAPFLNQDFFAVYEADNFFVEGVRLIANGIIGATKDHPIINQYIKEQNKVNEFLKHTSWRQSGPLLFTKIVGNYPGVLPPYTFLPIHHSGYQNKIEGTVYAKQFWSTSQELK